MVVTPNPASVGAPVTFDGSASTAQFPPPWSCPAKQIDVWEWDLDGDGSIDRAGARVQHIYPRGGAYRVSLTVSQDDAEWCGRDTTTETVSVIQPGAEAPGNTSAPTITGTAAVGEGLLADPGSWTGTTPMLFDYQWDRCDYGGGNCKPVPGALDDTYDVTTDDVGFTLRVEVTAANGGGFSDPALSAPTATVPSPPPPPFVPPPCDPNTPEHTVIGDENGQRCVTQSPPPDQPSDYVGDSQPDDLIDDSEDEPSTGFFPIQDEGSALAQTPWSNRSYQEAASVAASSGIPSDCLGRSYKAWFDEDDKLVRGQGEVICKKDAYIRIKVCIAVKQYGVSIFSVYDDVGCHEPALHFGRRRKTGKSVYCLSGEHKYRTHTYVWITRGSQSGSGSGYQSGRLKVKC